MQKKFLIIGIIVLLAIILGGGFLWMQKSKTPVTNVQNSNIQTADWKTYTNNEEKFSLDYPSDWEVSTSSENGQNAVFFKGKEGQFYILNSGLINNSCSSSKQPTEKILANDKQIDACYFINSDSKYWTMDTGTVIGISATANAPYLSNQATILKIFATFKFTGSQNQAAIWKTYTNNQYGFEIKIPVNWITIDSEMGVGFISPELDSFKKQNMVYCTDNNDLTVCGTEVIPSNIGFSSIYSPHQIISQKEVVFNHITFTEYVEPSIGGETHYRTIKNDRIFDFVFYSNQNLPNDIFSAFKFTK